MDDAMVALVIALGCSLAVASLTLGGMNIYQAVTGKRLSKRPSTRSDAVMRRQSAIAGTALLVSCALLAATMGALLASL